MTQDRRLEPRALAEGRALLVGPGLEMGCRLLDQSASGLRARLDRAASPPRELTVVALRAGVATPVQLIWHKGLEVGLKRTGPGATLRGLVPSRLIAVRDAWARAGGR